MRSWLSEMASSVPSSPSYFLGTLSRSITRPSASSPMATHTPPAPKSLQRLIMLRTHPCCGTAAAFCARWEDYPSAPRRRRSRWTAVVRLGGTGSAAAAVTAGAPAQQHHDIAGSRTRPRRTWLAGSSADHCADLHTLGHIPGVVQLLHLTGSQTDLVAVAAESPAQRRSWPSSAGAACLAGSLYRRGGIAGAGHTHRLIT